MRHTGTWLVTWSLALWLGACGSDTVPQVGDVADDNDPVPQQQQVLHPTRVLVRPAEGEDVYAIANEAGGHVVREVEGTRFFILEFPSTDAVEAFMDELDGDARVIDAERDIVISSPEGGGATLPLGSELLLFGVIPDQDELVRIGAPAARARATGQGVRVAVVDSGVVATHASLVGRIESGGWDFVDQDSDPTDMPNGLDDDGDGLIDEGFGHGTFVSSLVLALAPDTTILPYRVLNSDSTGLASHVAAAITMAADAGVHAINLSLGMEHRSIAIGEAIVYAKDQGVMVIASAGNTGNEEVTFPATISFATSVTSVGPLDVRAYFASYGSDMDLSAPGLELWGAYPVEQDTAVQWSGTSFSAALVTGAFCLVRELRPAWSAPHIIQHLEDTADEAVHIVNGSIGNKMGEGRLDLDAATGDE